MSENIYSVVNKLQEIQIETRIDKNSLLKENHLNFKTKKKTGTVENHTLKIQI